MKQDNLRNTRVHSDVENVINFVKGVKGPPGFLGLSLQTLENLLVNSMYFSLDISLEVTIAWLVALLILE